MNNLSSLNLTVALSREVRISHVFSYSIPAILGSALLLLSPESKAASPQVHVVTTSIQAAVDAAQPGDVIFVPPGVYRENVNVNKDDITIRGSTAAILDGEGLPGTVGIRVAPVAPATRVSGFRLNGMTIRNYSLLGALLSRNDNYRLEQTRYENNGEYGPFPVFSTGGVIAFNRVSGSDDAGIYIGRSSDAVIAHNSVTDCLTGIEVENSTQIEVTQNEATGNSIGIVTVLNPDAPGVVSDVQIRSNRLLANNRPNDPSGPLPSGIGVLNVAGDNILISDNVVTRHNSAGIAVVQLPFPVSDPFPDNVHVVSNVAQNNGGMPDPRLAPLPGADLLWDLTGTGNCWSRNIAKTSFPNPLPQCP